MKTHSPVGKKTESLAENKNAISRKRNPFGLQSNQMLQRKVRVGSVNDPMEAEADRVAEAVMSGESAQVSSINQASIQRKCSQCMNEETQTIQRQPDPQEEEEMLQMKADVGGPSRDAEVIQRQSEEEEEMLQTKSNGGCTSCSTGSGEEAASAVSSGGQPLSSEVRSYFEPRFGRDFSDVRVHTHSGAERASRDINAKAFTLGNSIAFSSGQYSPSSNSGRQLLAHELAHVVQQKGGSPSTVRRTVSQHSACPASVHGAPANPLDVLRTVDAKARHFSLGASHLLSIASVDPTIYPTVTLGFRRRFADPPAVGSQFRNRWNNSLHPTREEAMKGEMEIASRQLGRISDRFTRNIVYRCSGNAQIALENCSAMRCQSTDVARVCPGTSMQQIQICPGFWATDILPDEKAGGLIHEVVHGILGRSRHPQARGRRHRNPECYASFVADMYNTIDTPFIPFDVSCPPNGIN